MSLSRSPLKMRDLSPRKNSPFSTLALNNSTCKRSLMTAMAKTRQRAMGYMPNPPPFQWCAIVSKKELIFYHPSAKKSSKPIVPKRVAAILPPSSHRKPPRLADGNLGAACPVVNRLSASALQKPQKPAERAEKGRGPRFRRVDRYGSLPAADGPRDLLSENAACRPVRRRTFRGAGEGRGRGGPAHTPRPDRGGSAARPIGLTDRRAGSKHAARRRAPGAAPAAAGGALRQFAGRPPARRRRGRAGRPAGRGGAAGGSRPLVSNRGCGVLPLVRAGPGGVLARDLRGSAPAPRSRGA